MKARESTLLYCFIPSWAGGDMMSIHVFPKGIRAKCNVDIVVQDLNSGRQVHLFMTISDAHTHTHTHTHTEKESVCVCVCVCVRERERERKRNLIHIITELFWGFFFGIVKEIWETKCKVRWTLWHTYIHTYERTHTHTHTHTHTYIYIYIYIYICMYYSSILKCTWSRTYTKYEFLPLSMQIIFPFFYARGLWKSCLLFIL